MPTTLLELAHPALRHYYVASSAEEALSYLRAHHGEAQLLGGGTLLMPQVQRGLAVATRLVDVSRIGPMKRITAKGEDLLIGGAASFACLAEDKTVRSQVPLLHEAAAAMGTPQVRHLATLAGNVVSAEGNAEGLVALLTLGADAEITNLTGAQWLPVSTLLARSGVSRVDSSAEIVTMFRVRPLEAGQGSALERAVPPAAGSSAWPGRATLVLAVALTLDEGDVIHNSAWVLGAEGDLPARLAAVERELAGAEAFAPATRKILAATLSDEAGSRAAIERAGNGAAQEVRRLGLRAFDRALEMARQTRDAAAARPGSA